MSDFIIYYSVFIGTHWIINLITFLMDFYLKTPKINHLDNTTLKNIYVKIFPTVFFNVIILSFFCIYVITPYINIFNLEFSFIKMVFDMCFIMYMTDIFIYSSHRLFHTKLLYSWSHRIHHELYIPIGLGAFYNHWFDYIICVFIPTILPCILLSSHSYTVILWIIISVSNSVYVSHGGFMNNDTNHYYHHQKHLYNYGTGIFMDKLFKTIYPTPL